MRFLTKYFYLGIYLMNETKILNWSPSVNTYHHYTHSQRNILIVVKYITGNKNSQRRYGRKSASNMPTCTAVLLYVTGNINP